MHRRNGGWQARATSGRFSISIFGMPFLTPGRSLRERDRESIGARTALRQLGLTCLPKDSSETGRRSNRTYPVNNHRALFAIEFFVNDHQITLLRGWRGCSLLFQEAQILKPQLCSTNVFYPYTRHALSPPCTWASRCAWASHKCSLAIASAIAAPVCKDLI